MTSMTVCTAMGLIMFGMSPVLADSAQTDNTDVFRLDLKQLMAIKVVSASRSSETITKAPATLRVINQQQIKHRGYHNLADILQDSIGFDHAWAAEATDFNRVGVRGIFGNNKILILQDGIRISPPTGDVVSIAENFPLHSVSHVEILFGPASALYGADAMTAVINLITLQDSHSFAKVELARGENNHHSANFLANWAGEDFTFRLAGHVQKVDYNSLTKDFPDNYQLVDLVNFSGDTVIESENRKGPNFYQDSSSIDVRIGYQNHWVMGFTQRDMSYSTAMASRPEFVDYGKEPRWEASLKTAYLQYHTDINETLNTELSLTHNTYALSPRSGFANIFVGFEKNYKYAAGEKTDLSQLLRYQINAQHALSSGYSLEKLQSIPITADLPSPYRTSLSHQQQAQFFPGTNNELAIPIYKIDWRNQAIFTQLQSAWSPQWSSTVGLRYDHSTAYGNATNPRLGLVYEYEPGSTIKASYAEAFLAPSPQNSYRLFGSFAFQRGDGLYQSFFFQLPNTKLEPETLKTLELSWTTLLSDHWLIESSIYTNRLDNQIQALITPEPMDDFIDGGNISTTQINANVGSLASYGLDLSISHQGMISETITSDSWLNYSFVDGVRKTQTDHSELPFTSHHKFRAGTTLNWQHWYVSPSIRWQSASSLSEVGIGLGRTADAFTVVDLQLERRNILPQLDVYFEVNNLLDARYGAPGEGSATVTDQVPQLARWFVLGVHYHF